MEPYVIFNYGLGGSSLSEATGHQDYSIKAGTGFHFGTGLIWDITQTRPHRFEAQLGVSWHYQFNSDVSWSRFPIDALYFYRNTQELFRLGWGIIYVPSSKISGRESNGSVQADVHQTWGWSLAAEKLIQALDHKESIFNIGIRYNNIIYKSESFTKDVDGSNWMITFTAFKN